MKLIHKIQVLIVASGSGAAMPQKAIVERGYKGRIYQRTATGRWPTAPARVAGQRTACPPPWRVNPEGLTCVKPPSPLKIDRPVGQ